MNAFDDNDNNIYLVDEKGNPTEEVIAETRRPYDFLFTNEDTGGFVYDDAFCGIEFTLSKLRITGNITMFDGRIEKVYNADLWALETWIQNIYKQELSKKGNGEVMDSTRQLLVLKDLSANNAPFDLKVSMGLPRYTAVYVGLIMKGKPMITSLRAAGNFVFGSNMRYTANTVSMNTDVFYSLHMVGVGVYNILQNGASLGGHPYYGEHKYSGSYIYYGYYGKFYD